MLTTILFSSARARGGTGTEIDISQTSTVSGNKALEQDQATNF